MTRHPTRSRKVHRRRRSSASRLPGSAAGAPRDAPISGNRILRQLRIEDREALLADAVYRDRSAGHALARVGDPISTVYFPDSGVISVVSEMTTGHQVSVAAVGAEGAIGIGTLFERSRHPLSLVVLVESRGFEIPAARLRELFHASESLRRIVLAYVGTRIWELMTSAACNRVHSHRQRLARWLLITTDKARQRSLSVTHEALAQMVGGPRHAVTVALNELRAKGAIAHLRGRIDVLDRSVLIAQACECYSVSAPADVA